MRQSKQGLYLIAGSLYERDWKRGSNAGNIHCVDLSAGVLCSIVEARVVYSLFLDTVSSVDGRGMGGSDDKTEGKNHRACMRCHRQIQTLG